MNIVTKSEVDKSVDKSKNKKKKNNKKLIVL